MAAKELGEMFGKYLVIIIALAIGIYYGSRLFTKKNKVPQTDKEKKINKIEVEKISGIGGWLVLPITGLFISLYILFLEILSITSLPQIDLYIKFLVGLDVILLVLTAIALILIYLKKKYTPKFMIAFYIIRILIYSFVGFLSEDYSSIPSQLISGAIWASYFSFSKRVKNTFTR